MTDAREPAKLIDPLWHGIKTITLTTQQYRMVRMRYPTTFLYTLNGLGHLLKHRSVGAGLYEVWLERAP